MYEIHRKLSAARVLFIVYIISIFIKNNLMNATIIPSASYTNKFKVYFGFCT